MRNNLALKLPEKRRIDHLNGVQVVGGSNPLTPTIFLASKKPCKVNKKTPDIKL
jgi:hypothetical protein